MTDNGIKLELEHYCAYCGHFSPDVDKLNISNVGEYSKYLTSIKCENRGLCKQIEDRLRNRL